MIATMDRLPFTQLFQHGCLASSSTNKPNAGGSTSIPIRPVPLQSPTVAEPYPISTTSSYHLQQHPTDNMPYAVQATTSVPVAVRPSSCSAAAAVQSSPPPPYQNELLDPREQTAVYLTNSSGAGGMQTASMMPISSHPPLHPSHCLSLPIMAREPAGSAGLDGSGGFPKASSPTIHTPDGTPSSQTGRHTQTASHQTN